MTREQFLLIKLAEECAEVAQRALKQVQFGANQIQKANEVTGGLGPAPKEVGLSNAQRLLSEIIDFAIIVDLLADAKQLPDFEEIDFDEKKKAKVEKMNKYLAFAREQGGMEEDWWRI